MLTIANYYRNTSEKYSEVLPHTSQNGHHKQQQQKKNCKNNKCWEGCGELLLVGIKLVQSLWRTVRSFLKKLKIELPCDPANPLLAIYMRKTLIWKNTCTSMFIAALFSIVRIQKQPKCPVTDEWIKKMEYIYTMEYYSATQK